MPKFKVTRFAQKTLIAEVVVEAADSDEASRLVYDIDDENLPWVDAGYGIDPEFDGEIVEELDDDDA